MLGARACACVNIKVEDLCRVINIYSRPTKIRKLPITLIKTNINRRYFKF